MNKKYTLTFKLTSDISQKYKNNLPLNFSINKNELALDLDRFNGESGEVFIIRAEKLVLREIRRISILESSLVRRITLIKKDPEFNHGFIGQAATGLAFMPVKNPGNAKKQNWESDLSVEIKLLLWEKINLQPETHLIYAYLHMIWELCEEEQQWLYLESHEPSPLQEIPILRNLLLHTTKPSNRVKSYLALHETDSDRCLNNLEAHLSLALQRLHIVKSAVYKKLLHEIGYKI